MRGSDVVQLLSVQAAPVRLNRNSLRLLGNAHRLRGVLTDLAGNAVKFQRGEVALEYSFSWRRNRGRHTFVSPSPILESGYVRTRSRPCSAPFTKADTSTTRKYRGADFHLAISKRLVEMMGGEDRRSKAGKAKFNLVVQRRL